MQYILHVRKVKQMNMNKKFFHRIICIIVTAMISISTVNIACMETPVYAKAKSINILFVGNSMTSTVTSIPRNLNEIIKTTGDKAKIDTMICFGKGFKEYADPKNKYGKQLRKMLKKKKYDYIVFQEQPSAMVTAFEEETYPCFKTLKKLALKNGAKPILFMTWRFNYTFTKKTDKKNYKYTPKQMINIMSKNSLKISADYNVKVVTVGLYFEYSNKKNPNIFLWRPNENKHQGKNGAYLASCVFYRELFGKSTENIDFIAKVLPEDAAKLRKVADVYMSINKTKVKLKPGKTVTLKGEIKSLSEDNGYLPSKDSFTFKSADKKVATVDKKTGKVKAIHSGKTLIYITSKKTGLKKACSVVVK